MTETKIDIATLTGKTLKAVGAWQTGHFILTSGKHSDQYMQCQKLMQYPRLGNLVADLLVAKLSKSGIESYTVVGPALGAIHWELYVAQAMERYHLRKMNQDKSKASQTDITYSASILEEFVSHKDKTQLVKAVFAEKVDNHLGFAIRRGIELAKGEKVLVVEDVTTTGGSARKVVELIHSMGCDPVAVAAVVDRSGGKASFDVPFVSLLSLDLSTYDKEDCPMCKEGSEATKPGSSKS